MVRRSIDNWEGHLVDIYTILTSKLGVDKALKFMDIYYSRYGKYGRSFIDYKLAINLIEDYKFVEKIGTRLIICVGEGGMGKSTLLKNVLYWLDPQFNVNCIHRELNTFVLQIRGFPSTLAMRSILLDEPDIEVHGLSKKGAQFRSIVGTWRQQNLFVGLCATDLIDIPTYLFRKAAVILFVPYHGTVILCRNRGKQKSYVVQEIRLSYGKKQKGYNVFWQLWKESKTKGLQGIYRFRSSALSPIDIESGKEYIKKKAEDYRTAQDNFLRLDKSYKPREEKKDLTLKLLERNPEMRASQVAKISKVSPAYVSILKKRQRIGDL